jgi:hypothetical protein
LNLELSLGVEPSAIILTRSWLCLVTAVHIGVRGCPVRLLGGLWVCIAQVDVSLLVLVYIVWTKAATRGGSVGEVVSLIMLIL